MLTIACNPNTGMWELLVQLSDVESISLAARETAAALIAICNLNHWQFREV